ncbi:type IV toxin-antitoxin system antitoxin YafW [Escherichia coli]|nr:type IV toxin-antitoxin system antitoxin YafW [Escherichia coli]HCP8036163.1 type IV toxin-antitoxin system antitoxin YafW [Escherichia coli]
MSNPTRGLQREITLRLGARLVQEGNRLHYLADRARITGKFSDIECRKLDETFPHFIRQMESMLTTGELSPHHAHCVTLYHNDLTCEADTFGSCGYVYLAVYPTPETKK